MNGWRSLMKSKPQGSRFVLLFNPRVHYDKEPCLGVVVSNPIFARMTALSCGYTHWAEVPYPLPRKQSRPKKHV